MTPELQLGDRLTLSRSAASDGITVFGRLREVTGSLMALWCPECPFSVGERLRVELTIWGDARYTLEVRLRAEHQQVVTLELLGPWQRIQRREYFRIGTGPIPVQVTRERQHRTERDARLKTMLRDVSAGGAQLETDLALTRLEQLRVRFELPELETYPAATGRSEATRVQVEVLARVERVVKLSAGRRRRVGVCFLGVTPALRMQLLRWIYALQARRRARDIDALFEEL